MKGAIRTKEKCPKCGEKFVNPAGQAYGCPTCFTMPGKFYLDLSWQGKRIRLFKDRRGELLDSYNRANRLLERIRGEIDDHSFDPTFYIKADKQKYQFDRYVWDWFELKKDSWAHGTQVKHRQFIRKHIIAHFQDKDIREIRGRDIANFHKKLNDSDFSDNYIKHHFGILHSVFKDAFKWDDIQKIPAFPSIKVAEKPFKWITREDQEKILSKIKDHYKPIFNFLFLSGCRISEVTALKWDAVNLENRILQIRRTHSINVLKETTKTNDWRPLYITDGMMAILKAQPRNINGFVFNNSYGKPCTYNMLWKIWEAATQEIGIDITLYNATKHSWASQRINAGFTYQQIADCFGHSDIKMTKKYARVLTENLREVMEGEKVVQFPPVTKTVTKPSPGYLEDR